MILKGDCIEIMKAIKSNSVDAIVCDPPYGIRFMGKSWDGVDIEKAMSLRGRTKKAILRNGLAMAAGEYDQSRNAHFNFQLWCISWLKEAYRVLKPGGSLLAMGGSRTSHRLACAIEDSGFILKDTLMWLYGSGFPKAQDLGKMIDKRMGKERELTDKKIMAHTPTSNGMLDDDNYEWGEKYQYETIPSSSLAKHWDGFKIGGIKPAYEPILWAVKPPEGSCIDNVLKWEVGAVNVEECRVGLNGEKAPSGSAKRVYKANQYTEDKTYGDNKTTPSKGRFPANVILSHHPECERIGVKRVKGNSRPNQSILQRGVKNGVTYQPSEKRIPCKLGDKDGLETVESYRCHEDCPIGMLDEQSGVLHAEGGNQRKVTKNIGMLWQMSGGQKKNIYIQGGGASRFFYCAKASRSERNKGLEGMDENKPLDFLETGIDGRGNSYKTKPLKNNHPTVKPIALFKWLIKLVTREGQIVLDPFLGSGTTLIACHNIGRKGIGIEREDEYTEIAKKRIEHWERQPRQMEMSL